jgi:hypothetical protein
MCTLVLVVDFGGYLFLFGGMEVHCCLNRAVWKVEGIFLLRDECIFQLHYKLISHPKTLYDKQGERWWQSKSSQDTIQIWRMPIIRFITSEARETRNHMTKYIWSEWLVSHYLLWVDSSSVRLMELQRYVSLFRRRNSDLLRLWRTIADHVSTPQSRWVVGK